jgi:hypothetical protein
MQDNFNKSLLEFHSTTVLVKELQRLLGLSRDAAYRRLRGATTYTMEEAIKVANHFGISLDALSGDEKRYIGFQKLPYIKSASDFEDYLETSLKQLEEFLAQNDKHLYYSAKDIPIYYQFKYPHLGAFKMQVWISSLYQNRISDVSENLVTDRMKEMGRELCGLYMSIPTTEIWNETTVMSLFKQLEYFLDSGWLNKEEALQIIDEAEDMFEMIFQQATLGQRYGGSHSSALGTVPFNMYYHDILIMDNNLYFRSEMESKIFLSWAGLNFVTTSDQLMIHEMETFLEGQMARSTLMSGVAERERVNWKKKAKSHVYRLREKIEGKND